MLRLGGAEGEVEPAAEIVGGKVVLWIGPDNLGMALVKEGKGTTRRANINRLPEAVKNQNLIFEWRVQRSLRASLTMPPELAR